jgi:hypothetical protein
VASLVGGNDEEPGADGEADAGNEGVGEADAVEVQMAALHEQFADGGLGLLELAEGGARVDGGGRRDAAGRANPATDGRFQVGEKPASGTAGAERSAALMVVEVKYGLDGSTQRVR